MAEREKQEFPNWAKQERTGDLAWIRENLHIFWPAARIGYETLGRGAVIVDTASCENEEHPLGYLDQAAIEFCEDDDIERMVREYDPDDEFVTILFKDAGRRSAYRVVLVAAGR